MNIDSYLSPCTKLNSKWFKDFNIKSTILNLIEEKVEVYFNALGQRPLPKYNPRNTDTENNN